MLFGKSLQFKTSEAPEVVLGRLSAIVLPIEAAVPLRPVRIADWMGEYVGKRFVGRVEGSRFKVSLLPSSAARFRARGSVVIIAGRVQSGSVQVNLRLPLFLSMFMVAFTLAVASVLALSFFGPSRGSGVQVLLALALVLPILIVGWFFRREAALAERALQQVLTQS